MPKRHPVIVTYFHSSEIKEARGWIAEAFEDAPANLSDAEVIDGVQRHYDGGWPQFCSDVAALLPVKP